MKYPELHASRASSAKPKHPTSTAPTVYQYAIILCLAVSYILHDRPQRVQHSKTKKHNRCPTCSTGRSASTSTHIPTPAQNYQSVLEHRKGTGQDERYGSWQASPKPSPNVSPGQSRTRTHTPRRDDHRPGLVKAQLANAGLAISSVQMSEAWARIRTVSCVPIKPSDLKRDQDGEKKRVKKVRWGIVQTREFKSEAEGDDEATAGEHEHHSERTNAQSNNASDAKVQKRRAGRELWGSVQREGKHDIWGPREGSDGQLN